jgi:tRNA (guanine-N7-)-methyltransferase
MERGTRIFLRGQELDLAQVQLPLDLCGLCPGGLYWEVELGFGKGRYLLRRSLEEPQGRFLGVEVAAKYFGVLTHRATKKQVPNLMALCGEALFLLATVLPRGFARRVHVYFPDPWPKSRHRRRRLLDPSTLDLVLGLLVPGGRLAFVTDFQEYGETVREILSSHPGLAMESPDLPTDPGGRTNYEAKYLREGRPITRLQARLEEDQGSLLHPQGRELVCVGYPRAEA